MDDDDTESRREKGKKYSHEEIRAKKGLIEGFASSVKHYQRRVGTKSKTFVSKENSPPEFPLV